MINKKCFAKQKCEAFLQIGIKVGIWLALIISMEVYNWDQSSNLLCYIDLGCCLEDGS